MKMRRKGILIVVSGFSGVGKGTLMKQLVHSYDNYALSVSMTTRQPRPGESDGKEYFFVSREVFEKTIAENGLIEYAKGKDVILEIEIQGALKVREQFPTALLLFVMPPSAQELKKRLEGRGTETEEVIDKRLKRATEEAEGIENYDFIVINDKLEECVKEMHGLILAAHETPDRNQEFIDNMRKELENFAK